MPTSKKGSSAKRKVTQKHFKNILDGIDDVIYVADPETYELLFVNDTATKFWGDNIVGKKCHKALQNRDEPCPFCSNEKIFGDNLGKTYYWEFQNEITRNWYRCADKAIRWVDDRIVRFELASDITDRKNIELNLEERVKELKCLQHISNTMERDNIEIEQVMAEAVEALSKSWRFPESTVARITVSDSIFQTGNFDQCVASMSAAIQMSSNGTGKVEVGYIDEHPEAEEGPFLTEERDLIDAVAELLGVFLSRRQAEQELLQHQEHLEQEIAKRTDDLQRQSYELTTIMDSIPGLVFYKDADNRYIRVNQFVADAHKAKKMDLEGKSCWDLYPEETAKAYWEDDMEVIRSGKSKVNIDEPWETEDGVRWVNTNKVPFYDKSGKITGVIGISLDVTERKQFEREIAKQAEIRSAINRVFHDALTCETVEEVAQSALRMAEQLTTSKFGFIGEVNEEGKFDTIGLSDPGWNNCQIENSNTATMIRGMDLRGIWATVLQTGKPLIVDEPSKHPDSVGTPSGHPPLTSFLGVPFVREGKTVGMIALANKEGQYTQDDQEAIEALASSFYEVVIRKRAEIQLNEENIIKAAKGDLSELMSGNQKLHDLCQSALSFLCNHISAQTGLMFIGSNDGSVYLEAVHAHRRPDSLPNNYRAGEGLVGQAVFERKPVLIQNVPDDYIKIESGLGATPPRNLFIMPIIHNRAVKAVFEFGFLEEIDEFKLRFIDEVGESIAMAVESAQARFYQAKLLEESQQLSEELQSQQEELRTANEELEEQAHRLKESEERLKTQQEELQVTNEELEEKNELLERQKREVEVARREIETKAEELALASKYKSEFLANMSHELRTPLNSLLLLAQSLSKNKENNLTNSQVEAAQVIYGSGTDLLNLINEILDLAKIEAGRMDLQLGNVEIENIANTVRSLFEHVAKEKNLTFDIVVDESTPAQIVGDRKRIDQVLKNLLSNAIKFTDQGGITVRFGMPDPDTKLPHCDLDPRHALVISVTDTGIGISQDDQRMIFEAFQQVNGGTSRIHGGTGLGLSISREIANLLGGEIQVESEPGKGSVFRFFLPLVANSTEKNVPVEMARSYISKSAVEKSKPEAKENAAGTSKIAHPKFISDDRENIVAGDNVMLVIEDDPKFAKILYDKCRSQGFKCVATPTGESGIVLADQFLPVGIILDIRLPGMDGWSVLAQLKENTKTRHIPVNVASVEESTTAALRKGAIGHVSKPVSLKALDEIFMKIRQAADSGIKRVLVVEDQPVVRQSVVRLIADENVRVDEADTGEKALKNLSKHDYQCMVLDLGLPDMSGLDLLRKAEAAIDNLPPVIIHTASDLSRAQEAELQQYAETIVLKDVRSKERLLDEVSLFLHRMVSTLPDRARQIIKDLHETDELLKDKTVLVVDDDMRTLFAISRLLNERGLRTIKAENGEEAIAALQSNPEVDIVLMDIMMPVVDGYEAMRTIRTLDEYRNLPIIALTAKAMKDDRNKCIEAGANDYMAKPIDEERLISLLRVWLYR